CPRRLLPESHKRWACRIRFGAAKKRGFCKKSGFWLANVLVFQRFESADTIRDGHFGRQPFDARSAKETDDALRVLQNVLGIFRLRDRSAVTENENVRLDSLGGV